MNQAEHERSQRPGFAVDFIDPLFAVAVSLGLAGLATRSWFTAGRWPTGSEWFPLFVFLLGSVTLVWSWVGYHQSIIEKPLKGLVRFFLDVILVSCYAVLLLDIDHFGVVLNTLVLIYGFFFLWDVAKIREYPDKYTGPGPLRKKFRRELVTVVFFVLFGLLALFYQYGWHNDELALVVAVVLTFVYRLWKFEPIWRWHKITWGTLAFGARETPKQAGV